MTGYEIIQLKLEIKEVTNRYEDALRDLEDVRGRLNKSGVECQRAVRKAIKAEREACAKECDVTGLGEINPEFKSVLNAAKARIIARGQE